MGGGPSVQLATTLEPPAGLSICDTTRQRTMATLQALLLAALQPCSGGVEQETTPDLHRDSRTHGACRVGNGTNNSGGCELCKSACRVHFSYSRRVCWGGQTHNMLRRKTVTIGISQCWTSISWLQSSPRQSRDQERGLTIARCPMPLFLSAERVHLPQS
jgi:hypothetical protein